MSGNFLQPVGFQIVLVTGLLALGAALRWFLHPKRAPRFTIPVRAVDKGFLWDRELPLKSFPFKNAEYKLTMGIRRLDPQDWLLVESSYRRVLAEKHRIITNCHPGYAKEKDLAQSTVFWTPEANKAICEFYDVVANYMCCKYPMHFQREKGSIHNRIIGEKVPSSSTDIGGRECLFHLAKLIEEDFIILLKDSSREHEKDGTEYFFKGGIFAFAAGFDPKDRFNTPLSYIHHPIPGYESKLKVLMNRFFARIEPGQFVTRSNFSVQTHSKYYVDDANKGHNTPESHIQVPIPYETLDFERQVHYRSERQTLTKLPELGAVVFTIRTYLHPMCEIKKEPKEVAERLVGAIRGFPDDISQYKRSGEWGPPVIRYLEEDGEDDALKS